MKKLLAGLLILITMSLSASAHDFYYTINVTSIMRTDANNNLLTLEQTWDYDQAATKLMLDGEPAITEQVLKELGKRLIADLLQWSYFTELRANGKVIARKAVNNYHLSFNNERLKLELMQTLDQPLPLAGTTLEIDMADPMGIGLMVHGSPNNVKTPSNCSTSMTQVQKLPPDATFEHGKPVQLMTVTCQ